VIRIAIEMGYGLVDVFEFLEYSETYDRGTNSGGHFAEYVNMFLKLKRESSGHPSCVGSEEDRDRCTEDYRRAERNCFRQGINFQKCGA